MRLESLRTRLARVAREMPANASSDSAAARNARRLASIEREPEGPRRDFAIQLVVRTAANMEEPEDLQALVDAIGAESIARVFPTGLSTQPVAFFRARTREWHAECQKEAASKTTSELRNGIAEILGRSGVVPDDAIAAQVRAQIAQEKAAQS
jgi:hypothetical protein